MITLCIHDIIAKVLHRFVWCPINNKIIFIIVSDRSRYIVIITYRKTNAVRALYERPLRCTFRRIYNTVDRLVRQVIVSTARVSYYSWYRNIVRYRHLYEIIYIVYETRHGLQWRDTDVRDYRFLSLKNRSL